MYMYLWGLFISGFSVGSHLFCFAGSAFPSRSSSVSETGTSYHCKKAFLHELHFFVLYWTTLSCSLSETSSSAYSPYTFSIQSRRSLQMSCTPLKGSTVTYFKVARENLLCFFKDLSKGYLKTEIMGRRYGVPCEIKIELYVLASKALRLLHSE